MPLDKLTLLTAEYLVKDARKVHPLFSVQPKPIKLQPDGIQDPVLFKDGAGNSFKGQKAYLNTDLYQMTINERGLVVQFNPSKPYHPFELVQDDDQLKTRIKAVTDDLQGRGVNADWDEARVSRIDLAKNAVMNNPVSAYGAVFNWLNVKRASQQALYPAGYSASNNQFGTIFYNKGLEMQQQGVTVYSGDNLLRAELQVKRNKAVATMTGCKTLGQLKQAGISHLKTVYRSVINDRVFRQKEIANDQYVMQFGDEIQVFKKLVQVYGKQGAISRYLQLKGMPTILQEYGSLKAFTNVLDELGYSRKTRAKYVKILQQQLRLYSELWKDKENNVSKLYRELLYKIAV